MATKESVILRTKVYSHLETEVIRAMFDNKLSEVEVVEMLLKIVSHLVKDARVRQEDRT